MSPRPQHPRSEHERERQQPPKATLMRQSKHPVELVTEAGRLITILPQLMAGPRIAIDTESDGFHRYPERLCFVQLATETHCFLLDPLGIGEMEPLGELLANPRVEKVMHSVDYDLRSLDREWGFRVRNLYDTSIAAKFIGLTHLGLGSTLTEVMGVTLTKEKRLQRADWSERPLSEEALAYASDDVGFLLTLRERLGEQLEEFGRTAWVAEENARMEDIRHIQPESPETAFLSIKGAKPLTPRGLAILKALVDMRDHEARRRNRPPFRVLPSEALLHLAAEPHADLGDVPGLTQAVLAKLGGAIRDAVLKGLEAPPIQRPRIPANPRPTPQEQERLKRLRDWRSSMGKELHLDPSALWPMPSLERLARNPQALTQELGSAEVRRWQAEEFGQRLRDFLAEIDVPPKPQSTP